MLLTAVKFLTNKDSYN